MFIGYVTAICQKAGISHPQGAQSIGGGECYAMHQVLLRGEHDVLISVQWISSNFSLKYLTKTVGSDDKASKI